MELYLASTSPARRALLDGLGVAYRAESPGVDEAVDGEPSAAEAVALLARRKAEAVRARHPGALVLGADQLGWFEGRRLGKPADRDAARGQLRALSGKTHALVTGVCLLGPKVDLCEVDEVGLSLYPLGEAELERYLDTGEWEGCAGSYRVEGRGQALMAAIDGDRTSVMGLPMLRVVSMLRRAGFPLL